MAYKQDMAPPGGYAPITYQRVPLKKGLNAKLKLLIACGVMGVGWIGLTQNRHKISNEKIEMRCARMALYPMLLAEKDRMLLKQLRRNRDAEERIMKDVPGWEVGKWKHMPIYNTLDPDEYFPPDINEYFAHADEEIVQQAVFVTKRV